jgi:hypothetical protein
MGAQFAHRDKTLYILKRLRKDTFRKLVAVTVFNRWLRRRASGAVDEGCTHTHTLLYTSQD